jgi:hypothetical protein
VEMFASDANSVLGRVLGLPDWLMVFWAATTRGRAHSFGWRDVLTGTGFVVVLLGLACDCARFLR